MGRTTVCRPLLAAVCAALGRVRAADLTFAEHPTEVLQMPLVGRCGRGRSAPGRRRFVNAIVRCRLDGITRMVEYRPGTKIALGHTKW